MIVDHCVHVQVRLNAYELIVLVKLLISACCCRWSNPEAATQVVLMQPTVIF